MEKVIVHVLPRAGSRTVHQAFLKAGYLSVHHHHYTELLQARRMHKSLKELKCVYEAGIKKTVHNDDHTPIDDIAVVQFDCEPNLVFVCKELGEIYPKAKRIHIIRHPKDWVGSMSKWTTNNKTWLEENRDISPVEFPPEFDSWGDVGKLTWAYYALNNYIIDCGVDKLFKIERGFAHIFKYLHLSKFDPEVNQLRIGATFVEKDYMMLPENWEIEHHLEFEMIKTKYQGKVPSYGNPNIPRLMKYAIDIRFREAQRELEESGWTMPESKLGV